MDEYSVGDEAVEFGVFRRNSDYVPQDIAWAPVDVQVLWGLVWIHVLSAVQHLVHVEILLACQQGDNDVEKHDENAGEE